MFCPKCGQKLEDGVPHICPNAPVGAQPQYIPVQPVYALNTSPATPMVAALRKISSSTFALILTVALSVSLLTQFIGLVISMAKLFSTINLVGSAASIFGASSVANEIRRLAIYRASYGIIGLVPLGLTVVGCFITYLSAKNPQNAYIKSSGFVFFKVVAVIDLIFSVLSAVGFVLLLIVGSILMSAGELEDYIIYWITFCIVFVLVNVLKTVAYIGLMKLSGECKTVAECGIGNFAKIKGVSSIYAVIKAISVLSPIFSLIFYFMKTSFINALINELSREVGSFIGTQYVAIANFSLFPSNFLSGIISPIALILANVSIAVLVFSLNKKMASANEAVYMPSAPIAYAPYNAQNVPEVSVAPVYQPAQQTSFAAVSETVESAETAVNTESETIESIASDEGTKDE